MNSQLKFN